MRNSSQRGFATAIIAAIAAIAIIGGAYAMKKVPPKKAPATTTGLKATTTPKATTTIPKAR